MGGDKRLDLIGGCIESESQAFILFTMMKMLCESKPLSFFESAFICRSLADKIEEMLYHFIMFLM